MSTTIGIGNRRLLKLADYLADLPRGKYNQASAGYGENTAKCAMAYTWDLPSYKRYVVAAEKRGEAAPGASSYFSLDSEDYMLLFGTDGCKQKDGRPATTGKQAAKFIRALVKQREAA